MNATSEKESAFKIVSNQLAEAVAAPKCHKCNRAGIPQSFSIATTWSIGNTIAAIN
jgi:hypothetical protein